MSTANEVFQLYANYVNPFKVDSLKSIHFDRLFNKAEGCYVYDSDGSAYLDFVSGFGSNTLGHNHPGLMQKLIESLLAIKPNINPYGITSEAAQLAERLVKISNNKLNKVYFSSTGSEAVESALKFAMAYNKRNKFISIKNGFHGLTLSATALADNAFWHAALPILPMEVDHIQINNVDELNNLLSQKFYSAIILEPIQGSSGSGAWYGDKLQELAYIAKKHGALIILDEVMTGLGRTGDWFAYQTLNSDFEPDIVVTSKGLTGGLIPLSAVLMNDIVYGSMFNESLGQNHAATFSENRLAVICGLSVLKFVEQEKLLDNARNCGNIFKKLFHELEKSHYPVKNINVIGLCISFEIVEEDQYQTTAMDVCLNLLEKKILTALTPHEPNFIRLTPPLNINFDQIKDFFHTLKSCF